MQLDSKRSYLPRKTWPKKIRWKIKPVNSIWIMSSCLERLDAWLMEQDWLWPLWTWLTSKEESQPISWTLEEDQMSKVSKRPLRSSTRIKRSNLLWLISSEVSSDAMLLLMGSFRLLSSSILESLLLWESKGIKLRRPRRWLRDADWICIGKMMWTELLKKSSRFQNEFNKKSKLFFFNFNLYF